MNIRIWIMDIADTFNYRIPEKQLDIYESDLSSLGLSETELESLVRQVRHELDRFPSLAQLWAMARSATRTKNSVEPRWRIWKDREGRPYAQKLSGYQATVPTREDLERWKREACPTEEGIRIFREAYCKAGGDISKLPLTKSMAMEQK